MSVTVVLALLAAFLVGLAIWWLAWSVVLRWLRVIWVCRVAALSGGLALALFWAAEPARDVFLESQPYSWYWFAFFSLLLVWALVVQYAAHKVLEQQAWGSRGARLPLGDERVMELRLRYRVAATWVPAALGALCFLAVAVGIWGADNDVRPIIDVFGFPSPGRLLWPTGGAFVIYVVCVLFRRRIFSVSERDKPLGHYLLDELTGRNATLLTEARVFWILDFATQGGRAVRAARHYGQWRWDAASVALLVAQAVFWVIAVVAPLFVAEHVPRALFMIVMLGLPVSLLSFLSVLSHQWRLPVIGTSVLVLAIATGLTERFHDLRTVPAPAGLAQVALGEAVERWKAANCPGSVGGPERCQARPVIVASAGGASRAAFFTATIIGEMLDDPVLDLRHRLFAISGVSGGSVGAVMLRAALASGADGKPACDHLARGWWGPYEDYGPGRKNTITWKTCLQTLLAGDFLSPAILGLAVRDLFGFIVSHDRAALLEQSFERRYDDIVVQPSDSEARPNLGDLIGQDPAKPRSAWIPLLLLNATSVNDGRRTIISDLQPILGKPGGPASIFPSAFDLFRTRACAANPPCPPGPVQMDAGVRLSTAAAASARFPVISPQATVRDRDGGAADELVDGGYFENDGLTTARELAQAVTRLGLDPIIVHVTNNPTVDKAEATGVLPLPRPPRQTWYEGYAAPFQALVGTRDGHAAEALERTRCEVPDTYTFQVYDDVPRLAQDQACSFTSPGSPDEKAPVMKDLSMSWWLSGAVQAYLDRQLCHPKNVRGAAALKTALSSTSTPKVAIAQCRLG